MLIKFWGLFTLILVALVMGTSFAHALEMPAKLQYAGRIYLTLQQTLYVAWGPPNIGGILEPGAILAALILTWLVRRHRPAFFLMLAASFFLLLAFPVIFFLFVEPANAIFRTVTAGTLPANWMAIRQQWEYGHAARFASHLLAFIALGLAAIQQPAKTTSPTPVLQTTVSH